ncbi:S8 family peptidase [Nonomuraea sp. SBT364]|uniref:S8 family peptidase n=1 Tax=Nonomuraea sp. SBT364 TaxID=1580530 RepID=UPI00069D0248|nr:S8 family serine peptidase [Nonomuraea sp. SBT364]
MLLVALATTSTVLAATAAGQADAGDPVISPALIAQIDARQKVRSIIEVKPGQSVSAVAGDVEKGSSSARVLEATESPTFFVAEIDAAALAHLKKDSRVKAVYEDGLSKPFLAETTKVIGADKAHAAGWTGKGTTVAVLDTGIDRDHPFLAGRIVDEACFSTSDAAGEAVSLCPNGQSNQTGPGAADAETQQCLAGGANHCDHGTHVAGIAAGKMATGAPADGVAPEAGILPIQVFTRINSTATCGAQTPCLLSYTSDQKLALEYLAKVAKERNVAAVNMSLGGGGPHRQHCDADPGAGALKPQFDQLLALGTTPVVAAGNDGWTDAVASPACVSSAVTVGATDDTNRIATFSNRGTLLDLLAPGVDVNASVPDDAYGLMSGTSMAAPHVAGSFALLKQAFPNLTATQALQRLQTTGLRIEYTSVATARIDLGAATAGTPQV